MKKLIKSSIRLLNKRYAPYSRLIPVGESMGWAIDREIMELSHVWKTLGVKSLSSRHFDLCRNQSVFLGSQFSILDPQFINSSHRLALAYFHGLPEQGHDELDRNFKDFVAIKDRFSKIQVSHEAMLKSLLDFGFSPTQVCKIPIAVNDNSFRRWSKNIRTESRIKYGVPENAFVIGSFQKDGVGWGEGNEPKMIKGPDVFLQAMERLNEKIPNLFVLLSGPSRGYVKNGLNALGIPFVHHFFKDPAELFRLYECLDLYVVASRDEGGPKAILESMVSEIPLISTKVGQAVDLIRDTENAFMVDVEDVDAIVDRSFQIYKGGDEIESMRKVGYQTALQNTYMAQIDLWKAFMQGFVNF